MNLTGLTGLFPPFSGGAATDVDPTPAVCGADLMSRGAAWHAGRLQAVASLPVVLQRGAAKVALCATPGRTLLKLGDGFGGVRMEWTDRDWLIPAARYDFGAGPVTPEPGDLIKVNLGGVVRVFEVLPYGTDPAWRWSDDYFQTLRVHAKQVV